MGVLSSGFSQNEEIQNDEHFLKMIESDKQIFELTDTTLGDWDEDELKNYIFDIKNASSLDDIIAIYERIGINHASEIVFLFEKKAQEIIFLLQNNSNFQNLSLSKANDLLAAEYNYYLKNNTLADYSISSLGIQGSANLFMTASYYPNSARMLDACSEGYGVGMEACDDNFASNTAWTLLGAAFATVIGTPVAGAMAITSGIGAAYLLDRACRKTVVQNWRICRKH